MKYKVSGDSVLPVVVWDGRAVALRRPGEVCELSDRLSVDSLKKLVGNGPELAGVGAAAIQGAI